MLFRPHMDYNPDKSEQEIHCWHTHLPTDPQYMRHPSSIPRQESTTVSETNRFQIVQDRRIMRDY